MARLYVGGKNEISIVVVDTIGSIFILRSDPSHRFSLPSNTTSSTENLSALCLELTYRGAVAAGYGLDDQGVCSSISEGQEFSILHIVQTCCGAQPASYETGSGGPFPGHKGIRA
jgi:hypothetical protein